MAGPTVPTNRANSTNKGQDVIDAAIHEGGVACHAGGGESGNTRIIVKQAGAAAAVASAYGAPGGSGGSTQGSDLGRNNGVIAAHDDNIGRFDGDLIGR
jgi:hypothetical protein